MLHARRTGFQLFVALATVLAQQLSHRLVEGFPPLPGGVAGLVRPCAIVSAHRGDIWVDSGPGPGSVFGFTIPRAGAVETETIQQEDPLT
jgi:hypothetical protein